MCKFPADIFRNESEQWYCKVYVRCVTLYIKCENRKTHIIISIEAKGSNCACIDFWLDPFASHTMKYYMAKIYFFLHCQINLLFDLHECTNNFHTKCVDRTPRLYCVKMKPLRFPSSLTGSNLQLIL